MAVLIFGVINEIHNRSRHVFSTIDHTIYQEIGDNAYPEIAKSEDQAPLPIPPSAAQKGRVMHIPILMYHHVGDVPAHADAVRRGLTVSAANFEQQVKWLKDQGYQSVYLNDLKNFAKTGKPAPPAKPLIFTFDDGYDDVFVNAIPILKKYGYTGAFGIITNFPGTISGTNTYATWEEIAQAKTDGFEIVCHTQNHFDGSNKKFTSDYIFQNLSGCQQDIKSHLGDAEPILIYPYGHYTAVYIQQAQKVGFTMALTVHAGAFINMDDLMELPRVRVNPNEPMDKFIEKLSR